MKITGARGTKASALVTVMIFSLALALLMTGILRYGLTERRVNALEAMRLEARNAAEAVSDYGLGQIRQQFEQDLDFAADRFAAPGMFSLPPDSFWQNSRVVRSGADAPELLVGRVRPIPNATTGGPLHLLHPTDPSNRLDPFKGRYVYRYDLRVLAKAIVGSPAPVGSGQQSYYLSQTLSARAVPLFSYAFFYNMDLELAPGGTMVIDGPVHTNGNLYVKSQNRYGGKLQFVEQVSVAGYGRKPGAGLPAGLYYGLKIPVTDPHGVTTDIAEYTTPVIFPRGSVSGENLYGQDEGIWRDHKWGNATETEETAERFGDWALDAYDGSLLTPVHDVPVFNLPTIGSYVEDPVPSPAYDHSVNDARRLIQPGDNNAATREPALERQKYANRCGIYIVVNSNGGTRDGHLPGGGTVSIPSGKYRAFTSTGQEIVLPGQPDYGPGNSTRNTGANLAGPRIVTIRYNEMYDMRRARFDWSQPRSAANPYEPRVIDMIDIDMTALKLAVDRTVNGAAVSQVYSTATPDSGTPSTDSRWTSFIYNPDATPAAVTLTDAHVIANLSASAWNGAIYIESIAAETQRDSGVRLVNGRGRVASLPSRTANEGLTIATNNAVYILGHYNADGTIDTSTIGASSSIPSSTNSSSAYEASETPCSVVGDAVTILSQPVYRNDETTIKQIAGWNDALSIMRFGTNSTAGWRTTSIDQIVSNSDGDGNVGSAGVPAVTATPWRVPYDKNSTTLGNARTMKFAGAPTEVSAAFLAGIVPSNKGGNQQNSGGAQNYLRVLEDFQGNPDLLSTPFGSGRDFVVRGSIVAMFESRVAIEPWSWRTINAPNRTWGVNNLFKTGRFPPLTPLAMSYRRFGATKITPAEFAAARASVGTW